MRERLQINVSEGDDGGGCTGVGQQCPPPTVKIEKVNGGLWVFGVLIGNNCQISLPAFGVLFLFIGIILTIVAFKDPSNDEAGDGRTEPPENREETVKNIRILGPVCILVGITMLIFAAILKYLSGKAKEKQTRIGFYCPVHGDFYPLSPGIDPRKYSFSESSLHVAHQQQQQQDRWWSSFTCLKTARNESCDRIVSDIPPCPHSISVSNRSSFDAQHFQFNDGASLLLPPLPSPPPVVITATTISLDVNQNDGPIRSLSVPNEVVASFPTLRSRSNPPTSPPTPTHSAATAVKRLSCPILPEIGVVSPQQIGKLTKPTSILSSAKVELKIVQPAAHKSPCISITSISSDDESSSRKRKSVSIVLPAEECGRHSSEIS